VPAEVELRRVLGVVEGLVAAGVAVSVDTAKAVVAEACLEAGAEVVNDVTAGADPAMWETVARHRAGYVVMHMLGTPRTMQDDPRYDDVVGEVRSFLVERAEGARAAGIDRAAIVIDPGLGFGKTTEHNLELLRRLGELVATGYPVLVGASRKAFLGVITGVSSPAQRDVATAAVTALAVAAGAAAVRVHDVAASRQAAAIAHALGFDGRGIV
jgi:dihydropteroate synthase